MDKEDLIEKEAVVEGNQETKTYSEEEVNKKLQSETDKRVSQALQTAKAKWEEEYQAKLVTEKNEAEKLATMTTEEKFKAQLEQEKADFEAERLKFQEERMELETVKQLSSQGLPVEFSNYVVADNAENVAENIKAFKALWDTALSNEVDERLKGKTPRDSSSTTTQKNLTKAEFFKLSYKEREGLLKNDADLLKKLK